MIFVYNENNNKNLHYIQNNNDFILKYITRKYINVFKDGIRFINIQGNAKNRQYYVILRYIHSGYYIQIYKPVVGFYIV